MILLSCSTTNRTILAPPSIPGAEFVGSEECATCHEQIVRDFRTATHARLQTKKVVMSKTGAKGSETPKEVRRHGAANRATGPGVCTSKPEAALARLSIHGSRRKPVSNVTWKFAQRLHCLITIRYRKAK